MTDREKLIELLMDVPSGNSTYEEEERHMEAVADYLIENGVTIATDNNVGGKWIPVTERLPDTVDSYLVVVKFKYDYEKEYTIDTDVATYNPYEGGYIDGIWDTWNDWNEGQQYLHVTHWMPLPQPPKGE